MNILNEKNSFQKKNIKAGMLSKSTSVEQEIFFKEKELEIQNLYTQMDKLKKKCREKEAKFLEVQSEKEQIKQEHEALRQSFSSSRESYDLLHNEFNTLQQQYLLVVKENKAKQLQCFETARENSQLTSALAKACGEKEIAHGELKKIKEQHAFLQGQLQKQTASKALTEQCFEEKISEMEKEYAALISQLSILKENLNKTLALNEQKQQDLDAAEAALKESQANAIRLHGELVDCLDEKSAIEQALEHTTLCLEEEKENSFKAQQHLAKKMKENTLLAEENERKQQQIELISQELEMGKQQIETHLAHESQQHEILLKKEEEIAYLKDEVEQQKKSFNNKLMQLQNSLDSKHHELRDLKKMEDSYRHLMALIHSSNLPKHVEPSEEKMNNLSEPPPSIWNSFEGDHSMHTNHLQAELFSSPSNKNTIKNTLFD